MNYLYLIGTVIFVVYSQLVIKWRITKIGFLPEAFIDKIIFLVKSIFDPFIVSGFLAAFIGSLLWMAAMTKSELSYAYPIVIGGLAMTTSILAIIFFDESIGLMKITGLLLIATGLIFLSRG